jgi:hypothetical protein
MLGGDGNELNMFGEIFNQNEDVSEAVGSDEGTKQVATPTVENAFNSGRVHSHGTDIELSVDSAADDTITYHGVDIVIQVPPVMSSA